MNGIWEYLNYPLMHALGWTILHSLWQGAVAGIVFGFLRLFLRKHSAPARYAAGCVALCSLIILAAGTLVHEARTMSADTQVQQAAPVPAFDSLFAGVGDARVASAGSSPTQFIHEASDFLGQATPALTVFWLVGVSWFALRLGQGAWHVRTIRTCENEAVDSGLMGLLADLCCRLEISRPVQLLKSKLVQVPTVIGWLRPVVLLPASSLSGLTPGQLEAILVHELAHVRRLDYLVNGFQCALETLMFYHPVVWWISRVVREEREHCCDDLVLRVCGNRLEYARALTTLEVSRVDVPDLAFAASGGSLVNRVRRLLGLPPKDAPSATRQFAGLALVATGLVVLAIGLVELTGEPRYQGVTRIKVERDAPDGQFSDRRMSGGYDPYFIQTEFESIRSERVLGRVIKNLDLNVVWGKKYNHNQPLKTPEIIGLLKSKIGLRPIPNTSYVEIQVSSEDPKEAAQLANEVASAYQAYRKEERSNLSSDGLDALNKKLEEQEDKIATQAKAVDDLRVSLSVPDAIANADAPAMLLTAGNLQKLETLRIEKESQFAGEENLLRSLTNLDRGKLEQAILTTTPDTFFSALLEQRSYAEQRLVVLKKDYGPSHPEYTKVNEQIDDLNKKIASRLDGIMMGLAKRVESLKTGLDLLVAQVENAKTRDVSTAAKTRPYFEAKRKLEAVQRYSQLLQMRFASENIESSLPKSSMVQIMDPAHSPDHPSFPNRGRALGSMGFGLLLAISGLMVTFSRPSAKANPAPA
jgi:uncharacterized protein involved in exopolysaccharide biosynthesis